MRGGVIAFIHGLKTPAVVSLRKLVLCALAGTLVCSGLSVPRPAQAFTYPRSYLGASYPLLAGVTLQVRGDAVPELVHVGSRAGFGGVKDRVLSFDLKRLGVRTGTLTVTVRDIPDTGKIVFARHDAFVSGVTPELVLRSDATQSSMHYFDKTAPVGYNTHVGVDRTSGALGFIEFGSGGGAKASALIGKQYEYSTLRTVDVSGVPSVVRRLFTERATLTSRTLVDGTREVAMRLQADAGHSCDTYAAIVSGPIADSPAAEETIKELACREWRWLTPTTANAKLAYSISPYTSEGYGQSYLLMHSMRPLRALASGSPLVRVMTTSTLSTLMGLRGANSVLQAECQSTWVTKTSGVGAGYTDTRHNAGAANWLSASIDALAMTDPAQRSAVETASSAFGDYLVRLAANGSVIPTPHGYFFHDYYNGLADNQGHASLNHSLAEMSYLYELSEKYPRRGYRTVADAIRAAVADTEQGWYRPDGDLYYSVSDSGGFGGTDYPSVTLRDLIVAQEVVTRVCGARDPVLDRLGVSKVNWLNASQVQTESVTALMVASADVVGSPHVEALPGESALTAVVADEGMVASAAVEATGPSAQLPPLARGIPASGNVDAAAGTSATYAVTLTANESARFTLRGPAATDMGLRVYRRAADGELQLVASDAAVAYPQQVEVFSADGGQYVAEVRGVLGSGEFTLSYDSAIRPSANTAPEPLAGGTGTGVLDATWTPVRTYSVSLSEGEFVSVEATSMGVAGLRVRLRDADGWYVAAQHDRRIRFTVPPGAAGDYTLEIQAVSGSGEYEFATRRRTSEGIALKRALARVATLTLDATAPAPTYLVQARAGDRIWAQLQAPAGTDSSLQLMSPMAVSGRSILAVGSYARESNVLSYRVTTDGAYAITVSCADGSGVATLAGGCSPVGVDDTMPGATIARGWSTGYLNVLQDPLDVRRVVVPAGKTLTVTMSGPAGADFDMYLLPPGSTSPSAPSVRTSRGNSSSERITIKSTGGTYYLLSQAAYGAGTYRLGVSY